ncbi:SDR family NAD(P)-dependent oxidoreductase [Rhizorhabdus argentea]|uniref:SDR family NAD(P)-dependent oxidoreductase n=1 Tax=Rhizorhabdus argentea TaxID=1387174 RepID=UPI0030EF37E9
MSRYSYAGKTVLLFGGTSGIGRAVVEAFADAGANIVTLGRNSTANEALGTELAARKAKALCLTGDIAIEADIQRAIDSALKRFGSIDVAINNTGILDGEFKPLHQKTAQEFDAVFNVNVRGMFFALKHELAVMIEKKSGVIINMSSVAGSRGAPMMSLYVSSKHAVEGLTKSAALEAAPHGVRVLMVRPHAVDTPMIDQIVGPGESAAREGLKSTVPLGRLGEPGEQAKVILFLCSDDASYMTGSPVCIDGGYHAG